MVRKRTIATNKTSRIAVSINSKGGWKARDGASGISYNVIKHDEGYTCTCSKSCGHSMCSHVTAVINYNQDMDLDLGDLNSMLFG